MSEEIMSAAGLRERIAALETTIADRDARWIAALAELEAARLIGDILTNRLETWGGCPLCYAAIADGAPHADGCALAAYDRARKGAGDVPD